MSTARAALVTGGTTGIGRGITKVLLEDGYQVFATGLTPEECQECEKALGAGDRLATTTLDVRDRASCEAAVAGAVARFGRLDVLSSNAGVYPQVGLDAMTDDDLRGIFEINVFGTVRMVQAARPELEQAEHGRVVITSSITGSFTGYPGWSHYGATKAAQLGFMRTAAMELAPAGVTVNAVLPGNVATPGLKALGQDYMDRMAAAVPLGFLGDPEDIGHAVAYLASPGARYVTGQTIVVDGGQLLPESPEALEDMRR